jgi:hypothetical protein
MKMNPVSTLSWRFYWSREINTVADTLPSISVLFGRSLDQRVPDEQVTDDTGLAQNCEARWRGEGQTF